MKRINKQFLLSIVAAVSIAIGSLAASGGQPQGPQDRVTMCHKPGTPAQETLTLPRKAAETHIANHGDTLGACSVTAFVPLELAYSGPDRAFVLTVDADGQMTSTGIELLTDFYAYEVSGGDVDRDGDVDFLVSGDNSYGRLYLNNGDNSYTDSGNLFPGQFQVQNELVDIDNDGDLDAALLNQLGGSTLIYRNNGGVFTLAQDINNGTVGGFSANAGMKFADLNADGHLDLVFAGQASKVYLNDGAGSFGDDQSLTSEALYSVDIGDVDGDGDKDLIFVSNSGNAPGGDGAVFLNDGKGAFTPGQASIGDSQSDEVKLVDVDGDGDLDALLSGSSTELWTNNGSGTFVLATTIGTDVTYGIAVFDFDADGDPDLAVNRGGTQIETFENDGAGGFTLADTFATTQAFHLDAGDFLV
jgi:hypothetical protein